MICGIREATSCISPLKPPTGCGTVPCDREKREGVWGGGGRCGKRDRARGGGGGRVNYHVDL